MIQFNTPYQIDNGKDSLTFTEATNGQINGTYSGGTLSGTLDGNLLKASFHNTKVNVEGLMNITFHENGFEAKWKQGLDGGPMKGKWVGRLEGKSNEVANDSLASTDKFIAHIQSNFILNHAYKDFMEDVSTDNLVDIYSLEFDNYFFGELKTQLDIVVFTVDNSNESIEEHDGSDFFKIYYDFTHNCIYQQNPGQEDEYYKFLDTKHASIPEFYEDAKQFLGSYKLSDLDDTWSVSFHGNFESYDGDISDAKLALIKEYITSSTFYAFLEDVLDSF